MPPTNPIKRESIESKLKSLWALNGARKCQSYQDGQGSKQRRGRPRFHPSARCSAVIRGERFSALFHRARGEGSSFTQVYGSNKMAAMGAKGIELVQ